MDRKRSVERGRTPAKRIILFSIYFAVSLSDFKPFNIQQEEASQHTVALGRENRKQKEQNIKLKYEGSKKKG